MSKSKKLVFFGNERLATGLNATEPITLKSLIENGYTIAAVVSNYTKGTSRNSRELEIAQVAKTYNIPLLLPQRLKDIKKELESLGAEAAILVAYGKIIPKDIIEIFPRGIINIHPSLLPKYRGPTPIETAILNEPKETGVSLMSLSAEMDAGPVYAQAKLALSHQETKSELADKLIKLGADLLIKNLPSILDGTLKPIDQQEAVLAYTRLIEKSDALVDFGTSAAHIEHQVRAYAGWPKSRAKVLGQEVIITKARVAKNKDDGDLVIRCNPGWLEIQQLTAPSGRTISGAEFLRGYAPKS